MKVLRIRKGRTYQFCKLSILYFSSKFNLYASFSFALDSKFNVHSSHQYNLNLLGIEKNEMPDEVEDFFDVCMRFEGCVLGPEIISILFITLFVRRI